MPSTTGEEKDLCILPVKPPLDDEFNHDWQDDLQQNEDDNRTLAIVSYPNF